MTRNLAASLAMLVLGSATLAASPALADGAWSRSGGGTGPYGRTWSSNGSGQCAGGSCSSNQQATGPNGNAWTRSGATSCAGGSCNHAATINGPRGGSVNRNATWSRR